MNTVLAIQPEARQIGYAVFEGTDLIDWGCKNLPSVNLERRTAECALALFRSLISRHEPDVVVFPVRTETPWTARNRVLRVVRTELEGEPMVLKSFSRQEIRECFKCFLGFQPTKQQIMHLLSRWFPELETLVPRARRPWESQDYWVSMFDSVALAVTFLHNNA